MSTPTKTAPRARKTVLEVCYLDPADGNYKRFECDELDRKPPKPRDSVAETMQNGDIVTVTHGVDNAVSFPAKNLSWVRLKKV
jgi:hypothetical protein